MVCDIHNTQSFDFGGYYNAHWFLRSYITNPVYPVFSCSPFICITQSQEINLSLTWQQLEVYVCFFLEWLYPL